ncbi:MAG: LEA type 2 family protein [Planctomycetes bacterium]|nr:LEA type 2 family protein [Planctomycetota bacterium]
MKKMLLITAVALFCAQCFCRDIPDPAKLKELEFMVKAINIEDARVMSSTFSMTLDVYNPNSSEVTMGRFEFRFYADGKKLVHGRSEERLELAKLETKSYTVSVDINHIGAGKIILDFINGKKLKDKKYSLELAYFIETPFGDLTFTLIVPDEKIKEALWKD